MTIDWTTPARRDLDRIWAFNLTRGEPRAVVVEDRLIAAAIGLLANPRVGRPGVVGGTRELVVTTLQYVIVYEVADDAVRILRVWSTAERRDDTLS